jgi:hypothetical protein
MREIRRFGIYSTLARKPERKRQLERRSRESKISPDLSKTASV